MVKKLSCKKKLVSYSDKYEKLAFYTLVNLNFWRIELTSIPSETYEGDKIGHIIKVRFDLCLRYWSDKSKNLNCTDLIWLQISGSLEVF
jgi:hypothetical protein